MAPRLTSETARERELFRYHQPDQAPIFDSVPGGLPQPGSAIRSAHDAVLTAFAQLGCLRLDTKRAMISLVDRTHEYILAEATKSLSLQSDSVHAQKDAMIAGNRTIRKSEGIATIALDDFMEQMAQGEWDHQMRAAPLVIEDLEADDRFQARTFSAVRTKLVFYAGVPITTRKGYIIGVYSVIDDRRRGILTSEEMVFLNDIGTTIMDHLEMRSIKQQQYRAESMVKAMGLFVEGKSSLRDWWLRTGQHNRGKPDKEGLRRGLTLEQQVDEEYGTQEAKINSLKPVAILKRPKHAQVLASGDHDDRPGLRSGSKARESSTQSTTSSEAVTPIGAFQEKKEMTSISAESHGNTAKSGISQKSRASSTESELQKPEISSDMTGIFARAANLIREATGVEGNLFVDAGLGNFENRVPKEQKAPGLFASNYEQWNTSSSDEGQIASSKPDKESHMPTPSPQDKFCDVLGWSTKTQSSLHGHRPASNHLTVPKRFLDTLLQRYPHGKIFNFDDDGFISSSDSENSYVKQVGISIVGDKETLSRQKKSPRGRRKETKEFKRKVEAANLLMILPGARSVAFMPLWDPHKERWFAGCLSWSNVRRRVFDVDEDLAYLAAFGNSVMAEVSRTNALIENQRKNDLISSISHELRSPLHGVLASIEVLRDTKLDHLQEDMVSAIGVCGRTLLDVIDHVLDFAKINTVAKARKDSRTRFSTAQGLDAKDVSPGESYRVSDLKSIGTNLSVLVEEVIETILIGRKYHGTLQQTSEIENASSGPSSPFTKPGDSPIVTTSNVLVILDVDWQENWVMDVEPGAWRRIVMNLVTNALKYTQAGFVSTSLRRIEVAESKDREAHSRVTLTVTDSGKGISESFMKNSLFQPFSQEDTLEQGVGLGLSIVHQMVDDLGGSIEFHSEQGSGTKAVVTLTFDNDSSSQDNVHASDREVLIKNVRSAINRRVKLSACLVGFDNFSDIGNTSGILPIESERMLSLKSSIVRLLGDWYSIEVVYAAAPDTVAADVFISTESTFNDWSLQSMSDCYPGSRGGPPLIVVGSPGSSTRSICNEDQKKIVIAEPCGPYKIAQALSLCLGIQTGRDEHIDDEAATLATSIGNRQSPVTADLTSPRDRVMSFSTSRSLSGSSIVSYEPRSPETASPEAYPPSNRQHLSKSISSVSPRHPRILLVEDNEINLKLLVTYMRKLKQDFATAQNGLVALEVFQSADPRFDVVFMDISMPVMDGLTATREIRKYEHASGLQSSTIIALTAAASDSARNEAAGSGIDMYLTKPVPLTELKEIIDSWEAENRFGANFDK